MRKEIVMLKRGGYLLGICAICLFITSLPLFAQDQADSLYAQAKANENLQKYEEAKAAYQQIIVQYPKSPVTENARLRLSRCNALEFLAAGNDAAAQLEIAAAEKNFANHPEWPWFLCRIANEYKRLERHDQAKGLYEQVLRQYPDNPAAKSARLELLKYKIESLVAAGEDAAVQSEITKAKTEFAGRPELPEFLSSIANEYETLKKQDQAKGLYEQIVQQYPDSPAAKKARMEIVRYEVLSLAAAGKDAEVQSEITRAEIEFASRREWPAFLYSIANQYKKLKKHDQATSLYEQIARQYPNKLVAQSAEMQLFRYKIQSLVAAGDDAAVQSEITTAKNAPNGPAGDLILIIGEEYYNKAFTDDTHGRLAENSSEALTKAIEIWQSTVYPDGSRQKSEAMQKLGLAYLYLRQHDAAIAKYKEAMNTDPNDREYGNILRLTGLCYAGLAENGTGDPNAAACAESAWQTVVEKYPDDPMSFDAAMRLAIARERKGQWQEAAQAYEFFLSHCGNDSRKAQTTFRLGNVYEQAGQKDLAREAYSEYVQMAPVGDRYISQAAKALLRIGLK
jgi:TolA-binding protein